MKLKTYTSTLGLDRFPKHERFAKWQAAHKQLLRDDAEYRKRFRLYLTGMICLSCLLLGVYGYYFGVGLTSLAANLAVLICVVPVMVYVAVRQMNFMNQHIGNYFQSNVHDNGNKGA